MKEILVGLAEYNLKANEKLCEILKSQDEALLAKDQGAFYKSIRGTLEHIFVVEVSWLKKYDGFFSYPTLSNSWLVKTDLDEIKTRGKANFRVLLSLLHDADLLFVGFTKDINEGDLGTRVKYKNSKGEELQRKYWNTIVHILNHATHHRGEISAMLDMQGVKNDYSGFNLYTN